uniref:Uncharacterized protein n=1 Tax=Leersia perrieri TaxID=77586 RepID=A0A0D9XKP4_9ORYZ
MGAFLEEHFGDDLPAVEVSRVAFEEISFGRLLEPDANFYQTSAKVNTHLSSIVVSISLFDGDKMLFACSGIPLPCGRCRENLARFVTSAYFVKEFNDKRNRDDNLRVKVRLPDKTIATGFLGLYDNDIAIVTCLGLHDVRHIDFKESPDIPDAMDVLAAGRAFYSGNLMAMDGSLCREDDTWAPFTQDISKAVLGGPLLGKDGGLLGMNFRVNDDKIVTYGFLPNASLHQRLKHFGILEPKHLHFRGYSLPPGVSSIVPSGFLKTIYWLRSWGYPMPPPLVLEFNGELCNKFQGRFGDLLAWRWYPFRDPSGCRKEGVWEKLPKQVVKVISRRVVSLTSLKNHVKTFACTGLFIKLPGYTANRTVILTSANLVNPRDEDDIDSTLRIEVFLPPNQRGIGTLEFYDLNYNIAIVSLNKNFNSVRPQDIFSNTLQNLSGKVVAVGREVIHGPLMGTFGGVIHPKVQVS